jgi:hypothetical protein
LPDPPTPKTPVEQMWGAPDPLVVNRVVTAVGAPPEGLVEVPVLGYQETDPEDGMYAYVYDLRHFTLLGDDRPSGLIGKDPASNFAAPDTAELLVHVRTDFLCIPRAAVVLETDTTVQIAVYVGRPNSEDGTPVDHVAGCQPNPAIGNSILLPIELQAPIAERDVQLLDGSPIQRIPVVLPE